MNIFIDIETIPAQGLYESFLDEVKRNFKAPSGLSKKQALTDMSLSDTAEPQKYWTKADTIKEWELVMAPKMSASVADEKWRNTALDGAQGEIVCVTVSDGKNTKTVHRELEGDSEAMLIEWLFLSIEAMLTGDNHKSEPYFIGHNVRFDLKFLFHRAVILGVKPPFKIPFSGRHGSDFFCTMEAWAGFKQSISQDNLCKALGLPLKPEGMEGSKVWDTVKAGDLEKVIDYNRYDVEMVKKIYNRINFNPEV